MSACQGCFVKVKSEEAPWSTGIDYESGNMGHRSQVKGGYFPVPPQDTLMDIRNAMCLALEQQGVEKKLTLFIITFHGLSWILSILLHG